LIQQSVSAALMGCRIIIGIIIFIIIIIILPHVLPYFGRSRQLKTKKLNLESLEVQLFVGDSKNPVCQHRLLYMWNKL